ncbi:hypothetical protein QT235_18275 [Geobacillus stearothermophilus]|nr:hypothetical protein QT235_18275 [Geobacillus stearothermophilus]
MPYPQTAAAPPPGERFLYGDNAVRRHDASRLAPLARGRDDAAGHALYFD